MRVSTTSIDAYIAEFPEASQEKLVQLRKLIKKAVPGAKEEIKWGMPTYVLNGNVIHFAGYKNHIGMYPAPEGTSAFNKKLQPYRSGKNTIQFPYDSPLPTALIREIVALRIKRLAAKKKKA